MGILLQFILNYCSSLPSSLLPFSGSSLAGDRQEHFVQGSEVRQALSKSPEVCSS